MNPIANLRIDALKQQGKTVLQVGADFATLASDRMSDMLERSYPQPLWSVLVNGQSMTDGIHSRLISLTLTDNRGLLADTLEISLSDHDGTLAIPPKGALIELYLGWHTTAMVYKGSFIVNEITHQGTPDTLSIRAMSADLKETIRQKKERSFAKTTLDKIVQKIAHEHNLTAKIHPDLAKKDIYHLDQNESDISLLTRLATEFDATAMVKDDILLMMPLGVHESVSGEPLPTMVITRTLGDRHRYTENADSISGVRAHFYDIAKKDKVPVLVGTEDDSVHEIRYVHRDKKSATNAALAVYKRARRDTARLSYKLAHGEPLLMPQMPAMVIGIKDSIDAMDWTLTNVVHHLDDGGYTCSIECERLLAEHDEANPPITIGRKTKPKNPKSKPKNPKSKQGRKAREQKKQARAKAKK
ncbi:DNA primase [Moraxella haemolytica]|uniref:contractile injection system protein, VgrG/Pvc8 family n=1 Tax=Moraxella haemolytica TaxID=2904119 RepID=UPI002543331C|nr:contractile injection system protein, VgrG/Pvc8 family [Moraxella sp. ZY171148]WII94693.1 DNA primase [Moraxella sp. ZY171148]